MITRPPISTRTDTLFPYPTLFRSTPFCEGNFYGRRTKRFGSLLKRSPHVAPLVLDPLILAAVERILGPGCDRIQLNLAQAIEIHPGEVRQFPHRDHDMWRGADGRQEYLINILWPLTSFTADNGDRKSTRLNSSHSCATRI